MTAHPLIEGSGSYSPYSLYRHLLFTVFFCLVAGILLPHGLIEDESMNTPKNECYAGKYKYPELEVLVECW